jgi:peptide/nickel transport system substrate-binding protein
MHVKNRGISTAQALVVIVILVVAAAAATYFLAGSQAPRTTTVTETQTTTQTTTQTATQTTTQITTVATLKKPNPDILVVETIGQPDNLDPAIDYETAGGAVIQNVYEQLLFFRGSNSTDVIPWLASDYSVSPDGKTYTFHLRQGIKFTDGTPFNATAVCFSIIRAALIDDPDGPAWAINQVIAGGRNFSASYNNANADYSQSMVDAFLNAKPCEVLDTYTVAIHLEKPYAGWRFIMAFSVTAIVSPSAVIKNWSPPTNTTQGYAGLVPGNPNVVSKGKGITAGDYLDEKNPWMLTNMVGTGPYMLKSWDKATQTLVFVKNPNYWGGPFGNVQPTFSTVIVRGVDDPNTRVLDCKAGTVDICAVPVTGGLIFQFIDQNAWLTQRKIVNTNEGVVVKGPFPTFSTFFIGFNQKIKDSTGNYQSFQPFQDVRIRKAISLLWNNSAYIDQVLYGFAPAATQILPPGMFGYNKDIKPAPYDPQTAKQLLIDAGTHPLNVNNSFSPSNPKTIVLSYNTGNTARQVAATLLAAAINSISSETGLRAQVQELPWPQFLQSLRTGQANVFFLGWIVDYVDPDDFLVPFADGNAGTFALRIGWNNETVNQWIAQQAVTLDPAKRYQIIQDIQNTVNNQYVYIWQNYGNALIEARTWIREKPNSPIASNVGDTYLQTLYGQYWAAIEPVL